MSNCAKFDPFMIESLSFDGITIIHSIFEEAQRAQSILNGPFNGMYRYIYMYIYIYIYV